MKRLKTFCKLAFSFFYRRPALPMQLTKKSAPIQKIDPRPENIRSLPILLDVRNNIFGKRSTVFYYDPVEEPLVRQEIRMHHDQIRDQLKRKGIDFIFPYLLSEAGEHEYLSALDYFFPLLRESGIPHDATRKSLADPRLFRELIGFDELTGPCFIRSIERDDKTAVEYRIYHLPSVDAALIRNSIDFYLLSVSIPHYMQNRAQFSKGYRFTPEDPDDRFDYDDHYLSIRLQNEIDAELKNNSTRGAVSMIFFILQKMKEFNLPNDPSIKKLIHHLQEDRMEQPSRLLITSQGRILLTDFNKEIELTPLQKTVFVFFLLRAEGILFKDLPKYKKELMDIYSKISNRTSLETIQKSVNDLANPYSNSMSEKCSRIREAFMKSIDKRLAEHYCVNGDRNGLKRIPLDRSLVEFGEGLY
jgi:hypothetical protein